MKIAFDRNFIHSTFRGNNKDIQSLNFPYTSLHRQTDRDIFLKVSNSYSSNIVPDIEIPEDYDKEEFMKMLLSYEIRKLSENGNIDKRIDRDVTLRYLFQKLHKNNYTDFLVETFEKNNMGTVGDFRNFVSHVTKLDKQFDQCIYNFIEIFPSLNDKKDMENFPEILLTSKLASNYYKDPTIINKNVEFVKKMGYTNENKFYAAYYSIYADSFNCFTTPLDRYYLLEHVVETYDERFKVFKLITDPSSKKKDKELRREYNKQHIVIDYLDEIKHDRWAFEFLKIYKSLSEINSLSGEAKNKLEDSSFGCINIIENYINFLKFLDKEGISPKEANGYASNNFVSEIKIDEILKNRNVITRKLQERGLSENESLEFYKRHKDLINACFEKDEHFAANDALSVAIEFIKNFNIKDDKNFLDFYNKVTKKYQKSYPKADIINFVNTLSFLTAGDIQKCQKNKNLNVLSEARKKQNIFKSLDKKYREYVSEDGIYAFNIYKKTNDISKTKEIIQNSMYNLSPKEAAFFQRLIPYFETEDEAKDFVKNNINSGANKSYDEFGEYCIKLIKNLSKFKDGNYAKKLNESKFIKNSKHCIQDVMRMYPDDESAALFFKIVLDKNISQAKPFLNFLERNKNDEGKTENILKHFSSQNNLSFEEYEKYVEYVQNVLSKYNIPIRVNDSNILNLPACMKDKYPTEFSKRENIFGASCVNNLANTGEDFGNFVTKLENTYIENQNVDNLQISNELCRYYDKEYENYSSVFEKLFPNKGEKEINICKQNPEFLAQNLPNDFVDFINNNDCFKMNNKKLNISLHAKLRTFERFITDERNEFDSIDYKKVSERISEIYDIVYKSKPFKLGQPSDKNCFICYYKYNDSYTGEIKAIFTKDGKLVTIAPANR